MTFLQESEVELSVAEICQMPGLQVSALVVLNITFGLMGKFKVEAWCVSFLFLKQHVSNGSLRCEPSAGWTRSSSSGR